VSNWIPTYQGKVGYLPSRVECPAGAIALPRTTRIRLPLMQRTTPDKQYHHPRHCENIKTRIHEIHTVE